MCKNNINAHLKKKYFEKNPLEMEEETEEEDDKMEGGDFMENWDVLSL